MIRLVLRCSFIPKSMGISRFTTSAVRCDIFNIQDRDDFDEKVLKSTLPVIVDFHASWCGPCKMLGPRLETIVAKHASKLHLAKIDVDQHEDLAGNHNVESIPSVIAYKNGKIVDQFVGNCDDDQLRAFVAKLVG